MGKEMEWRGTHRFGFGRIQCGMFLGCEKGNGDQAIGAHGSEAQGAHWRTERSKVTRSDWGSRQHAIGWPDAKTAWASHSITSQTLALPENK